MSNYSLRPIGAANTLEHRIYFEENGSPISPFHDIPLVANKTQNIFNMVVEVPRWSNAKLEIATCESFNPIKQDVKKEKLRFVSNIFPHKGYITNYGYFPQTWEDPMTEHAETKAKGDNDPIDVCEIGDEVGHPGQVKQVKVLGVLGLLDEGETDWKVIAIDIKDPLAAKLHDIEDVERRLPGRLCAIKEWFRVYKIPDGKPENKFALNGEMKNKDYATEIIKECHESWEKLITGAVPANKLSLDNVSVSLKGARKLELTDKLVKAVPAADPKPAHPIDVSVDKWHHVEGASWY